MSADPLDDIDILISQISDQFKDWRATSWQKVKALIKTYGEQCVTTYKEKRELDSKIAWGEATEMLKKGALHTYRLIKKKEEGDPT